MKTVLHLSPSIRLFGARQSLLQLVTHLDAERWRPVVVVPQREGGLASALEARGIRRHTVRMGQWRKAKFWPRIPFDLRRLRHIARTEDVDLIHCNEPHVVPYGLQIAQKLGIPCVTHVRLDTVDEKLVQLYGLGQVEHVIAVSEAVACQFDDHWPDRAERVTVIPNGVDAEALRAQVKGREEARANLGIKDYELLVGQIGLHTIRKRCHVAIEAFAKLARNFRHARMFIAGNAGPSDAIYARSLSEMIEHMGLVGRVQLLPFRDDIGALFAALDLNLLVSEAEGFGRVIIEAAVFGVPTVGSSVGGIPEVIRNGETGLLVPLDDVDALADAMGHLLSNEIARVSLGNAARRDAEARFSISKHAGAVMDLFDEVAG